MRGNRFSGANNFLKLGSIPACAGEPSAVPSGSAVITVYPRVCGGTVAALAAGGGAPGLSPRVRGNPLLTWVFI